MNRKHDWRYDSETRDETVAFAGLGAAGALMILIALASMMTFAAGPEKLTTVRRLDDAPPPTARTVELTHAERQPAS